LVNIADAVALLGHLFALKAAPPARKQRMPTTTSVEHRRRVAILGFLSHRSRCSLPTLHVTSANNE